MDWQKFLDKAEAQRFGPNDSMIVSSIMHPQEALARGLRKLGENIQTAGSPYSTPDEAVKSALDIAGVAMTGSMPFGPKSAGGTFGAIPVFHGSPHNFDKFDLSKIGTGEGAQSYGHGLYFAENPATAEDYRKTLSTKINVNNNPLIENNKIIGTTGNQELDDLLIGYNGDVNKAINFVNDSKKELLDAHTKIKNPYFSQYNKEYDDLLNQLNNLKKTGSVKTDITGNLYNVSLEWPDAAREAVDPLSPEHFLDWDRPLSKQSEKVQQSILPFLEDMVKNSIHGEDYLLNGQWARTRDVPAKHLWGNLYKKYDPEKASQILNESGIPGIRYLDQGSRGAGEGTSNYVVFSDQIPRIVEKLRGNQ